MLPPYLLVCRWGYASFAKNMPALTLFSKILSHWSSPTCSKGRGTAGFRLGQLPMKGCVYVQKRGPPL